MKTRFALSALAACWSALPAFTAAPVPPAEQLLPADTLAVLSAPDWAKVEAARKLSPKVRFWNDPAMTPFREKFLAKLTKDLLEPFERQIGAKLADYAELLQGQVTLAITPSTWTSTADALPSFVLLLDTKDHSDRLKKNLADLKTKLTDSGRKLRTDKVRDVEFTTLVLDFDELGRSAKKTAAEPGSGDQAEKKATDARPGPKPELSFGQVGSLLLAGTNPKDLEKVLNRLSGGSVPSLAEQPVFESDQKAVFRDALLFGWIHFAPIAEALAKKAADTEASTPAAQPFAIKPSKVLGALGLTDLKTLAFSSRQGTDGVHFDLFLGVPEDRRKGLFKLMAVEAKDAAPPACVPADVVQFMRWRVDGQKSWSALQATINEIAPGVMDLLIAQLDAAMQQKDPGFDFRKYFVNNLGDDYLSYQKAPRGNSTPDAESAPGINLLASPNADQLLQTIRGAIQSLPPPLSAVDFKEREFLGKKIYSLVPPALPGPGGQTGGSLTLHLAASGGYLAVANDSTILEEYLRSGDSKAKPLAETPGFSDAVQKAGGTAGGLFAFQNDSENMRTVFEMLRHHPEQIGKALGPLPIKAEADKVVKEWADFSLLPPFEKVAKYFSLTVFAGSASPDGYRLRLFTPTPPQLTQ